MRKMEWYPLLPSDLLQVAYKASNGELAWQKKDALRVIQLLNANGLIVSAIETWLPTKPGPMPLGYDWSPDRGLRNNKLPENADEFVKTFTWQPVEKRYSDLTPVFNISATGMSA